MEPFAGWRTGPAPLLPAAIGVAGGIALDRAISLLPIALAALLVVAGGVLLVARRRIWARAGAVGLAGLAVGGVLHDNAYRRVPDNHIVHFLQDEPVLATVTGTVLGDPVHRRGPHGHFARWMRGRSGSRLLIDIDHIASLHGPIAVDGLLQVNVYEPVLKVEAGRRVRVVGKLYRPPKPDNPGQLDWSAILRRQGILAAMSCKHTAAVQCVEGPGAPTTSGLRARLRTALRRWLYRDVAAPDETASLLDALILGQRGRVSRDINDAFVRTGTAHFLCVSGTHVGMLAIFVWWLLRRSGFERATGAAIVMTVIAGYVLVAEPRVPILRAGILCALGCIAVGIRRRTSPLNWLAAGAIVILVWRPCDLFSPGFQLSFGVVLGILVLSPMLHEAANGVHQRFRRIPPELDDPKWQWPGWRRWLDTFRWRAQWLIVISVAAWLVGSALTAYHFGRFSPWGWLNSLLVWPLVMAIVIGGFGKVLLAGIWPQTTAVTGPTLGALSSLLARWVDLLDRLPGVSIECRPPEGWAVATYLVGLSAIGICWRLGLRTRYALAAGLLPIAATVAWQIDRAPIEDDAPVLWVLSVGSGQAALLSVPGWGEYLLDAGTMSGFDAGESVAAPAFKHLGVRRIRRAMISHANFDHYSGLLAIDDDFPIEHVVTSPHFARHVHPGGAARHLLDELERREIPILEAVAGDRRMLDDAAEIEVLWPPKDLPDLQSANDCSMVVRIKCAGRSILICGDIEQEAQRRLLERGDVRSDVLILPHHGAVVSSTAAFVEAVDPEVVIRSGGRGHERSRKAIEALVVDRRYFDTARDGAIEVKIRSSGIDVRTPFQDR